jgi:hypothetical protein
MFKTPGGPAAALGIEYNLTVKKYCESEELDIIASDSDDKVNIITLASIDEFFEADKGLNAKDFAQKFFKTYSLGEMQIRKTGAVSVWYYEGKDGLGVVIPVEDKSVVLYKIVNEKISVGDQISESSSHEKNALESKSQSIPSENQYPLAESLVIKGLYLGMDVSQIKAALEKNLIGIYSNCFVDQTPQIKCNKGEITDPISIELENGKLKSFVFKDRETIFNSKNISSRDFVINFFRSYKLELYFPKVFILSKLAGKNNYELIENLQAIYDKENAYCIVDDYRDLDWDCTNRISGIQILIKGKIVMISKEETLIERDQRNKIEEKKKQDAIKGLKFN